jgi:hypothetical protein
MVADPHSFDPNPDPMTKNWKKFTAENFFFYFQVTSEAFSSQKRTSTTSKHEIYLVFLLLWVIFALLDPDPDSQSGSTDPIESGSNSNSDPDPQPWFSRPYLP